MGILLAVDHEANIFEESSDSNQPVLSDAVFKLAQSHPLNFVSQLKWTLSDNPEDMFFEDRAEGPAACFQSPIWVESWLKTLGARGKKSAKFVTGKIAGQTVIAVPLIIAPGKFVTCVEFAGQDVSDYNLPIVHQHLEPFLGQAMLDGIIQQIATLFPAADCVDFRKVLVGDAAPSKGAVQWQQDAELTHLCELSGDWDHDLSQFIGKTTRKSLKKKKQRLETFGELTFGEMLTETDRQHATDKLIEWKSHQLQSLGAASVFENRGFCDFLKTTVMDDKSGMVRMFAVRIDAEPIALILALCLEDRWFLYQTSFTYEEPGKYSPGYLLLLHVMEEASRANVKTFDFGWGNEAYKLRFATKSPPLYNVFSPLTTKGKLALLMSNTKISTKIFVKSNKHLQSVAKFGLRIIGNIQGKFGRQKSQQ